MEKMVQINGQPVKQVQEKMEALSRENEELRNKLAGLTAEMNQFTYIVSHDLQAPLRTITGFLELLVRRYGDKLDDAAKNYIDFAVNGTAKMKNLIFDLLEYSRLSTDTTEVTEVDLDLVMRETIKKFEPVIKECNAEITIGHLPVVMAKKIQMEQLFQHHIDNSLKFHTNTKPEITITAKKESKFWKIDIEDNGVGIDSAYFEKIFIIFRRLYADETKYSGRGFGLAACKKIVELHGGSICVASTEGKGSIFSFTLPEKI
jgi:light-regulated signal transduction histidine kinase (bacteriophytochrome)